MAHPLERIYPYVPVLLQNLGISLYGVMWRRQRLGGGFARHVEGFRERESWSEDRMQTYLDAELRRVLRHAYESTPYYRERWHQVGLSPETLASMTTNDLPRVPITPKADLRARPGDLVARDLAARAPLRHFQSSGSTGTPITVTVDSEAHRRFVAAREARSFGWAGTSIRYSRSMIGGRRVVPAGDARAPFHRYNAAERQVYFSAFHLAPENVQDYVEAFNHYKPRLLTGYAYSHYILGRLMLDQGLTLNYEPDALVLSSEKLTPEMKEIISRAFRARAFEEYSSAENCVLATECERGNLHANLDHGILEVVDEKGYPVPAGIEGRILGTSLLNDAQPLIRYAIGDLGVWASHACDCGRKALPVLKEVVGRLEDVVTGPDGRQMVRFHWVFVELKGVMEGQIVQEALDRFLVRVVTVEGFDERTEAVIRERFRERLGEVHVRFERVAGIPRTGRGKFRAVISMVPPSADSRGLDGCQNAP